MVSRVLSLEASTEKERALENAHPYGRALFHSPVHHSFSKLMCFNFFSWVSTTDRLTAWGVETQSENEEQKILVECLGQITGSVSPLEFTPSSSRRILGWGGCSCPSLV